jgi:hypothetical protein
MGELRRYVASFFVSWERWACGAIAFVGGAIGTYFNPGDQRVLILIVAIAAFFLASFWVWRDEHRRAEKLVADLVDRDAELQAARAALVAPPKLSATDEHRDAQVSTNVENMSPDLVDALFKIALSGAESEHVNGMRTLANKTGFLRREGQTYYIQDGWREPVKRWADKEVIRRRQLSK